MRLGLLLRVPRTVDLRPNGVGARHEFLFVMICSMKQRIFCGRLLERKALSLDFDLSMHWPRVRALMKRWTQMDLADASIVVMSELHAKSQVLTVDRTDFSIYRRNDRQVINFISPSPR
jgi:hypothetical protein